MDDNYSERSSVDFNKKNEKEADRGELSEDTNERGNWGGQLEFILTIVGYAVGLGNVWRFPYLAYKNGGGAFLIPYFLMLAVVGMPLFFLELSFGQFASLGPLSIWRISPLLKGIGFAMVITNAFIAMYYNVIIAWSFYYLFASMTTSLPWETCDNPWNNQSLCIETPFLKENCTRLENVTETTYGCFSGENGYFVIKAADIRSPSEEYFYNEVLQISSGMEDMGYVVWQLALTLLLAWVIVFFVLIKGIASLGKVVYFSSIFPYVLLTIMLIRGCTLEGAGEGIEFYLKPDFSRLASAEVWSEATTQIFFSLSTCTGGLIAMASYNKFNNNCLRDSIMVPLINCGTSFYAGFAIFSVLGYMAVQKGVSVEDVADQGPGLVFVVYPEALSQMPAAPVWAVLFFLMLVTLGFSSEFSMTECVLSAFIDEFPALRKSRRNCIIFRVCVITGFFLLTLPFTTQGGFYLFSLVDTFVSGFPLLFIGLFEAGALMWVYGYHSYAQDVILMLGKPPNIYFRSTWCVITPVILLGIITTTAIQNEPYTLETILGVYMYPGWAYGIGWTVVAVPLFFIPGVFIFRIMAEGGCAAMKRSAKPTSEWGPALVGDRGGRYHDEIIPIWSGDDFLKSTQIPGAIAKTVFTIPMTSGVQPYPVPEAGVFPPEDKAGQPPTYNGHLNFSNEGSVTTSSRSSTGKNNQGFSSDEKAEIHSSNEMGSELDGSTRKDLASTAL